MKSKIFALSKKWQKFTLLRSIATKPSKRYQTYRPLKKDVFRSLFPFADQISAELIESLNIDRAIRINAEICFSKGTGYIDLQWKERTILVGLLALYSKNYDQAASWLAAGVKLQKSKLISRCSTYGFSQEFIDWVLKHQDEMTTCEGWKKIIQAQNTSQKDFAFLLLSVSTMAFSLGLKKDISALLSHISHPWVQDWKKILLGRIVGGLTTTEQLFTPKQIWSGSYDDVHQKILLNILHRVFSKPNETVSFVTRQEYNWLIDNNHDFIKDRQFYLLCQAFQLLQIQEPDEITNILSGELNGSDAFFDKLESRQGPLRIFIGGYGWTGSGAIFDSFRGYPNIKIMPGAGDHVPYLNEGAEDEPMVHQGPASVLAFANQIKINGNISIAMWKRFFRLYVLKDLPQSYFEYKTVHANKLICDQIGDDTYNLIIMKNVAQQAKNSSITIESSRRHARLATLKTFEGNLYKSLFTNDDEAVLFNNSVNTHKVDVLQYLSGKSVYIAVNRSIYDQLADQRRSNIFFNTSAFGFARTKGKKIRDYCAAKKNVEHLDGINFYDIQFEDWVKDDEFRAKTTAKILGSFSKEHDSRYFTPSKSMQNVDIYDFRSNPREAKMLKILKRRNQNL